MTTSDTDLEPDDFVRNLVEEFREGSLAAGEKLWDLYGALVRQAVRKRLPHKLRAMFDSEDFTQQVWASFFHEPSHLPSFDSPHRLVAYLRTMAHNKVVTECRKRLAGVRRNEHLTRSLNSSSLGPVFPLNQRPPTPSEVSMRNELLEKMVAGVPQTHRQIIELCSQGLTYREIGESVGLHENSVRRIMSSLYRRMME